MASLHQMLSARSDFGRSFLVAMWLLGALAAAQVIAVGWALVTFPKKAGNGAPVSASMASTDGAASISSSELPLGNPAGVTLVSPGTNPSVAANSAAGLAVQTPLADTPLIPGPEVDLPGPTDFPTSTAIDSAAGIENPAHKIGHPAARRMLAQALEFRASGNMQAALRSLRDAQALSPNHPRVLSELATTYSQMGLHDKAAEYWRSVHVLGSERAGAFYDLADMTLKGHRIENENTAIAPVLSFGEIQTIERQNSDEGERVTIRIPVENRTGTRPNPADMAMLVYFYDQVNGEDYAPTTADTSGNFVSEPYDWQDGGVEVIEETYFQPTFTEAEKKELGERRYFGYIIELYYRDELQDVVAEPQVLMSFKPGQMPATDNGRESHSTGPGAELFPESDVE